VTVVTPSFQSSYFLRRALAPSGLFNVIFTRLDDLAETLDAGNGSGMPLSRLHAAELVYAAAREAPFTGPLDGLRDHHALHSALHRAFDELGTAPGDVIDRLRGYGGVPGEVAAAWTVYSARSEKFSDRLTVARRAAAVVRGRGPKVEELGRLVVLLVEAPAPQYRPLLDALLSLPDAEMLVGLTGETDADSLVTDVLPGGPRAVQDRPEGAHDVSTHLVSAPDRATEVRWVVRNIAHLVATRGTRLSRIAVFYRDESYCARVDDALKAAGIPVAGPQPRTLSHLPEGRFLTGLLDVLLSDLARESVVSWITGAPVRSPDPMVRVDSARWDAVSRNAGVIRGLDGWRDRLDSYARGRERRAKRATHGGDAAEEEAAAYRAAAAQARGLAAFIGRFAADSAPPDDGASWADFGVWMQRLVDGYLDVGDGNRREQLVSVLERVSKLDDVDGPPPTFERFDAVVREQLEQVSGRGRPLGRGVFVAPLRLAVGTDFDAICLLGMTEGAFPPRDIDDPLLPDAVRRQVDPEETALPRRARRRAMARRRYLTALAAAPQRFLLWPRSEVGTTREVGPARWYVEQAEALEGRPVQAGELRPPATRPWLEWLGAPEEQAGRLDKTRLGDQHDYDLRVVSDWSAGGRPAGEVFLTSEPGSPLGPALRLEAARYGTGWTRWDGNLGTGAGTRVPAAVVSPTSLETWASCPFRYFLGHVLALEPVERPEEVVTISPLERGLLIHAALDRFDATRRERGMDPAAPDGGARDLLLDVLLREFRAAERHGVTGKPALWRVEMERIERLLLRFLDREARRTEETGQAPIAGELAFGFRDSDAQAVELDLADGTSVRFSGRMDRLEATPDRLSATVVDYKTGSAGDYRAIEDDPVAGGRLLQLPIYALAAQQWLDAPATVRADYWFVSEREGFKTYGISLDRAEGPARRAIAAIVEGIRGGVFPADPGERGWQGHTNCTYCPFDRLCPGSRRRMWERKRHDAALSPFTTLAETAAGEEVVP